EDGGDPRLALGDRPVDHRPEYGRGRGRRLWWAAGDAVMGLSRRRRQPRAAVPRRASTPPRLPPSRAMKSPEMRPPMFIGPRSTRLWVPLWSEPCTTEASWPNWYAQAIMMKPTATANPW